MFKLKLKPRFTRVNTKAAKGDIIRCNLPDREYMEFHVADVLPNGSIIGSYVKGDGYKHVWRFGERYDIIYYAAALEH